MWRHSYTAMSYDVYFGTSADSLTAKGKQTNNIFSPGILTVGETYYWRVDAVTPSGTITGDEWSFTVEASPVFTSFNPVADAYVDDNAPDSNKGNDSVIRLVTPLAAGGAYEQRFGFLKFDVDVPGTIISAKLKLYNEGTKSRGVNVHSVSDTRWDEASITWNNQPVIGAAIVSADVLENSWQEFDLTGQVTSNGLLSLALKRDANDSRRELVSKEGGNKPELIIEYKVPVANDNSAPAFTDASFSKVNGTEAAAYSASLADDASDMDGDLITFVIVSGPEWLQVSAEGSLSGVPASTDIGENSFVVKVTDSKGASATATLTITVAASEVDTGTDDGTGTGTDDGTGSGTDDGTGVSTDDDSASESSGGSIYYLAGLLLLMCVYRRRIY